LLTYVASIDDPEKYDGAPVAVQIVCPRHSEEKLFRMAQVLNEALEQYSRSSDRGETL
jgi:Asp-tRNA(Asn)/Glu-tRNA(Gln) amidotransferase A subunit family amidase